MGRNSSTHFTKQSIILKQKFQYFQKKIYFFEYFLKNILNTFENNFEYLKKKI